MIKIRTNFHIRTHRGLRSYRSCINSTGLSQILPDLGRIHLEECRRLNRLQNAGFKNNPRRSPLGA
jgi:hypothetical protein